MSQLKPGPVVEEEVMKEMAAPMVAMVEEAVVSGVAL